MPYRIPSVSYTHLKTDKEVAIQISDAKKQAEILGAEGEQEYMKILAQAYGEEDRSEF